MLAAAFQPVPVSHTLDVGGGVSFLDHRKLTSLQVQHFQAWLHRRACEGCLISPSFNYLLRSRGDRAKGPALMSGRSIGGNGNEEFRSPRTPARRRRAICLPVFAPSQQMVRRSDGVCLWTPSRNKAAAWCRNLCAESASSDEAVALEQRRRFMAER